MQSGKERWQIRALVFESSSQKLYMALLLAKASHTATCNFMEAMNSRATRGREPEISGGQHYCHPGRHLGLCDVDRLDQSGLRSG